LIFLTQRDAQNVGPVKFHIGCSIEKMDNLFQHGTSSANVGVGLISRVIDIQFKDSIPKLKLVAGEAMLDKVDLIFDNSDLGNVFSVASVFQPAILNIFAFESHSFDFHANENAIISLVSSFFNSMYAMTFSERN
jgi:hypothetical protein